MLMRLTAARQSLTTLATLLLGGVLVPAGLFIPVQAHAVEYKIYSPLVVQGETEVELRSFYSSDNLPALDGEQGYRLAVGHAFTDYWASEVYAVLGAGPGQSVDAQGVEWENRFQLTPQGKYWLDSGLMTELSLPTQSDEPSELALIPLFEKQFGRVLTTLNPFLEWQFGSSAASGTTLGYRGRVEYLLHPFFSPALEFHGEPGMIGKFEPTADQRHQVGPAFYGVERFGGRRAFLYSAAVLFGLTRGSPDTTLTTRLEYEF